MPAVDADAHAGVDIDMHPARPAGGAPPSGVSQETIESLYPPNPTSGGRVNGAARPRPASGHPDMWSNFAAPRRQRPYLRMRPPRAHDDGDHQRKATVTFRMPAKDFVRLRFASRDMEMSCQSIILEALDCYLDANDIAPVSDEDCESEVERLSRARRGKRPDRKTGSLAE